MTTPDERVRAQVYVRKFLEHLSNPGPLPGVPVDIRVAAESVLRHLASPEELRNIIEMTDRLLQAERQRDEYRTYARDATWIVLKKGVPLLVFFLAAGVVIGRVAFCRA